ncbi:MAG: ABC transporter substrate-binding protein [Candidatus Thorarchaeota archaeon]|nr:MAG: ABC transporter substrate-binding protein [Candidatus Thorarchaeota archaeon]
MDTRTKQMLAVLLVIVVVAGVGVVFIMLPPAGVPIGQLFTPGAPANTPAENIIIVGILDPMTDIQGIGAWQGAYMACEELNLAGGVTVDGEDYYFGVIAEDTSESEASLDLTKGTAAATKIIEEDGAQFIIGGFRSEALLAYQEIVMDNEMLLFGTGASTDIFCQNVLDNYDRYKYFFRVIPINSTSLASSLLRYIAYLDGYLTAVTGQNITKVAVIREDLTWTEGMGAFLDGYLPLYGLEVVEHIAYPITADAAAFATYWQQIDDAGAQITVPVISAQGGILMTTQYQQLQPKCIMAGIDVMGQLDTYWTQTAGACQYEVVLQSTIRTNKTTRTIPAWDAFLAKYGQEPIYNAIGSYDAMYILAQAIEDGQTFNSTELIPVLEEIDVNNPFEGFAGNIAFLDSHDVFEGYIGDTIYSVVLFTQWQAGGVKEALSSGGYIYPDSVVTAQLVLPPWGINP